MGAGSAKAHQSYTVAPATTSSGSVSQVPAASVADLESLAAEPGHDSAAAVLLVDPVDAASAVVADPSRLRRRRKTLVRRRLRRPIRGTRP